MEERDVFAERRQIALVLLGVVVTATLIGFAYLSFFRTSYVVLLSGLRPADAAAVVAVLQKEKTPYHLADQGTAILVPEQLADASRLKIASSDIPLKGAVGFEIFNKSDMGLTDLAQRVNYQRALQGELARTIMTMNGVDSARVHLSLPEQTIFVHDREPAKASVTVIMQPGGALASSTISGIQHLVASAVPNLDAADVAVLDAQGAVVSTDPGQTFAQTSPEIQQTAAVEQYYASRIRRALQMSGLPDHVQVTLLGEADAGAAGQADALAATPAPPDNSGISSFSPQDRSFGLRVNLDVPASVAEEERRQIVGIVRTAILFDATKGDAIMFGPLRPFRDSRAGWQASASPSGGVLPPTAGPQPDGNATTMSGISAAAAVFVTALVMILAWRWSNRRLSQARRKALAEQLAKELESRENGR